MHAGYSGFARAPKVACAARVAILAWFCGLPSSIPPAATHFNTPFKKNAPEGAYIS